VIVWASDFSQSRGEGVLARSFLNEFLKFHKNKKITIKTFEQKISTPLNNFENIKIVKKNSFLHKYIGPLYGSIYLLTNRKKIILYLNYLPLWNFLIFLLLPRKTILGPITGGAEFSKVNNPSFLLRKYIFPMLYKISLIIINIKFKNVIFSTNLLEKYVSNKKKKIFLFSYIYTNFINYKNKKIKKKFDLIFYNRKNSTKKNFIIKELIFKLPSNIKICVIGEVISKKNISNYGFVKKTKALELIKNSKLAFASGENVLSLFAIDAYNHKTGIIFDENMKNIKTVISKKNFLSINYNNLELAAKTIQKYILSYKFSYDRDFEIFLYKKRKKIDAYLSNYFFLSK
jgi:hypothetical protein